MESLHARLELDSRLSELTSARPWIEMLADRLDFPDEERFAMYLCVEEVLANVILHGYGSEPGHPIVLGALVSAGTLCISIDDEAPPFSPIEFLPPPSIDETKPRSLVSVKPGGNGIRLLKRFSRSLHYERLPSGNRLTISFLVPPKI